MWTWVVAGGWPMLPLAVCSVLMMAIVGERFWSLRERSVLPHGLLDRAQQLAAIRGEQWRTQVDQLKQHSLYGYLLGQVFEIAGQKSTDPRGQIDLIGREIVLQLERYLNILSTIATMAPFLGLLGTVIGMIHLFSSQGFEAILIGNLAPTDLAQGIAQSLVTTAFGLIVAIPSYGFYKFFERKIALIAMEMEKGALKLFEHLCRAREGVYKGI